jgi:hypothetical protein
MDFWTLLVLHAAATYSLFGLIWLVQWVHYPSFRRIDREHFREFAKFHMARISFLVVPLIFLEFFTGIGLCLVPMEESLRFCFFAGLGLIGAIWMVTVFVSIPSHRRLLQGFDEKTVARLILWNWVRTLLWTVRALGLAWLLWSWK